MCTMSIVRKMHSCCSSSSPSSSLLIILFLLLLLHTSNIEGGLTDIATVTAVITVTAEGV